MFLLSSLILEDHHVFLTRLFVTSAWHLFWSESCHQRVQTFLAPLSWESTPVHLCWCLRLESRSHRVPTFDTIFSVYLCRSQHRTAVLVRLGGWRPSRISLPWAATTHHFKDPPSAPVWVETISFQRSCAFTSKRPCFWWPKKISMQVQIHPEHCLLLGCDFFLRLSLLPCY